MKTPRGYMQGYNAQAVTNERQIVLAAEINVDSPDFGHLEPMVSAAERELQAAGIAETPQVVLADAGYSHQAQISRGVQVLIPPDAGKRKRHLSRVRRRTLRIHAPAAALRNSQLRSSSTGNSGSFTVGKVRL